MPTPRRLADPLRTAALAAALGTALAACAARRAPAAPGTPADAPVAPATALATFDSAWTRVRESHYDPGLRGIDWPAVRTELRPRAEQARTLAELRLVIRDMLGRLGESHFVIIPSEAVDAVAIDTTADEPDQSAPGDVGVTLRLVGGALLVAGVDSGSPAAAAGVRPGWAVDSVGSFSSRTLAAALARLPGATERREALIRFPRLVERLLEGPAGSAARVTFRDAADARLTLDLVRRPTRGEPVRFGNLPVLLAHVDHARRPTADGGCVGVIRFNIWMTPLLPAIDRAVDAVRDCRGIVLDLRGNPGGVGGMVMGVGGHFFDETTPLGVMKTRRGEVRFVANPRRVDAQGRATSPYAGPVAIVVDARSVSTSEIFAAGMQTVGRARIFGDTTAGQALPAQAGRLPTGDVLMHVVADFTAPDGRRIEGRGVVPDELTPLTRDALLAGRDTPLDAAVAWLRTQPREPHTTRP